MKTTILFFLKKLKMVAKSKKNGIIIMQLIYVTDEYPQFLYGYPGRHEISGQPLFFYLLVNLKLYLLLL